MRKNARYNSTNQLEQVSTGKDLCAAAQAASANGSKKRLSKATELISLMQQERGATIIELMNAAGWQRHSTRSFITSLRKKGHLLQRTRRDGQPCYAIVTRGRL